MRHFLQKHNLHSIMVQLLWWLWIFDTFDLWQFTFHYGSITILLLFFSKCLLTPFTFHYGSITISMYDTYKVISSLFTFHYGSITINIFSIIFKHIIIFTFHYGSITMFGARTDRGNNQYLHSIMVQLLFNRWGNFTKRKTNLHSIMVQLLLTWKEGGVKWLC